MAEPAPFTTTALQLERMASAGAQRAEVRARCASQAGSSGLMVRQGWRSPDGVAVADALDHWRRITDAPDRAVTEAYRSLGELAVVARRTAAAIDQARALERNVLGSALDRAGEARFRTQLNLGDFFGFVADEDAQRQRDDLDRVNRVREQAATEQDAALTAWSAALEATAAAVRRAADELRRNTVDVPAAFKPAAPTAPPPITPPPTDLASRPVDDLIPPMPQRPAADDTGGTDDYGTKRFPPPLINLSKANLYIVAAEAKGWSNSARHMRHYLENTGTTLEVDPDRMEREIASFKARSEQQMSDGARAAALQATADGRVGQPVVFTTTWSLGATPGLESPDWFYAMNEYAMATTGVVVVDPGDPNKVSVHYRTHVADRYNWDPKKVATIGPFHDSDMDMRSLQQAGLAREYDIEGTSSVHTVQIDLTSPAVPPAESPGSRDFTDSGPDPGRFLPEDGPGR